LLHHKGPVKAIDWNLSSSGIIFSSGIHDKILKKYDVNTSRVEEEILFDSGVIGLVCSKIDKSELVTIHYGLENYIKVWKENTDFPQKIEMEINSNLQGVR
jgi:WD40 repeat protein